MENLIFIKKTYNGCEDSETIYAMPDGCFEKTLVSLTYDNYGQLVDTATAGDGIVLLTNKAVELANEAYADGEEITDHFKIDDYVSDYDHPNVFTQVRSELKEGEDFEYHGEEVLAYNFWNGSNWQSIIIKADTFEPNFEQITDEDLINELLIAVEEREFKSETTGIKYYEGNGYILADNCWQGTFATWEITIK